MNTFYICRHGQTENNLAERLSGWLDTPLTPQGLANVKTAASKLSGVDFDLVYSSDLGRAFITASDITKTLNYTGDIHRAFGLRENGYGTIANMLVAEA